MLLASDRTAFDMKGCPGGIYTVFTDYERFTDWSEDMLEASARTLQLGLMSWRSQKIQELQTEARSKGKACMEAYVQAFDWTAKTHTVEA